MVADMPGRGGSRTHWNTLLVCMYFLPLLQRVVECGLIAPVCRGG